MNKYAMKTNFLHRACCGKLLTTDEDREELKRRLRSKGFSDDLNAIPLLSSLHDESAPECKRNVVKNQWLRRKLRQKMQERGWYTTISFKSSSDRESSSPCQKRNYEDTEPEPVENAEKKVKFYDLVPSYCDSNASTTTSPWLWWNSTMSSPSTDDSFLLENSLDFALKNNMTSPLRASLTSSPMQSNDDHEQVASSGLRLRSDSPIYPFRGFTDDSEANGTEEEKQDANTAMIVSQQQESKGEPTPPVMEDSHSPFGTMTGNNDDATPLLVPVLATQAPNHSTLVSSELIVGSPMENKQNAEMVSIVSQHEESQEDPTPPMVQDAIIQHTEDAVIEEVSDSVAVVTYRHTRAKSSIKTLMLTATVWSIILHCFLLFMSPRDNALLTLPDPVRFCVSVETIGHVGQQPLGMEFSPFPTGHDGDWLSSKHSSLSVNGNYPSRRCFEWDWAVSITVGALALMILFSSIIKVMDI